jgi:uncharacterized membrane protein
MTIFESYHGLTPTPPEPPKMKTPRLLKPFRVRPRLLGAAAFGLLTFWLTPTEWAEHAASRFLIGWNAGALLYLGLAAAMIRQSSTELIQKRALHQDEGRFVVLSLVVIAAVMVLFAIGSQLAAVKDLHGVRRSGHVALAALTVFSSWAFTQTMFAMHYAHHFYVERVRGRPECLLFPGTTDPDYTDFMYFACVIGTSAQTADVSFSGASLRGIGLTHCVLAFFFNTTVLALTINIAAGLF